MKSPKNKKKFTDILKEVKDLKELNSVMADVKIPYTKGEGNRFSDDIWLVQNAKNEYRQIDFASYLEPFPMAVCKIYLLLKAYGYIGLKPKNLTHFAYTYRKAIRDLCSLQPGIQSMMPLRKKDIDLFIRNNNLLQPSSTYRKLQPFRDAANLRDMLPKFLRMNKTAFSSPKFQELEDAHRELTEQRKKPGNSPRPPYPFEDLGKMMPIALELIENSDGMLDLIEDLKDVGFFDTSIPDYIKYPLGHKAIKVFKKKTGDPVLDSIIEKIKDSKNLRAYDKTGKTKGWAISGLQTKIVDRIKLTESACAIVVLVLGAMRRGELAKLSRKFEVEGGDDLRIHKVIFKTSTSLNGDRHTIPMPEVGVKGLKFLSRLASIRDGQEKGPIISLSERNPSHSTSESDSSLESRLSSIVAKLPESLNLTHLSPHQLRHIMAYLVMQVVGKEGLEIVRYLLGHSSILMTLTYLSRINPFFREVLEDVTKIQSKENLEALYLNMQKGKKVYGANAARFNGIIDDNMIDMMYEYWEDKIEQGWLMILLTPMAMCIHDLNNPKEMRCQRGLDNSDLVGVMPAPARCNPGGCSSAAYLEEHVVSMMAMAKNATEELQNDEIFKRLGENLYFSPNDFSIEKESGYKSIIEEYQKDYTKAI